MTGAGIKPGMTLPARRMNLDTTSENGVHWHDFTGDDPAAVGHRPHETDVSFQGRIIG